MKSPKCPNGCGATVASHPENGCVVAALVQVVRERGNVSERRLRKIHATMWVDDLWDQLGPMIDGIEEGNYSHE